MALPGGSIGTIFVEIDLDADRYLKSQQQLYRDATTTTLNIEANFKKLGIHSSAEMDLMRAKITNAYDMIAHSSKATANDIMRAEEAKTAKLKELAEQQFGHQTSLLENLKAHWIEAGAVIYAAMKFERMIAGWMGMAQAQDRVDRTLKAAMITNERFSETFYQSTLRHAEALQRLTGEDDAVIESAQRLLMTFNAVSNDLMPRTTKAVMNMSIAIGAEGGGLRGSTMALGKAMEGNTEGLRRFGIVIDENTYKLKGAEGVLGAVEAKVNGLVEAVGQGSGKWEILGSQWDEAKEKIGNFFNIVAEKSGLLDTLTQGVDKLNDALRKFNKLEDVYKSKPGENLLKDALGFDKELFNAIKYIQEQPTLAETILKQTKEVVPKLHELTDAEKNVAQALEKINDIIAKGILTPYQFEVYELDKKFQGLAKTLGWNTDVLEAYRLELERVRQKFNEFPDRGFSRFGEQLGVTPFPKFGEGLTLGRFSTTLTPTFSEEQITAQVETEADALVKRDLAVWDKAQAKIKQEQDELVRQWNQTAQSIGSNFTDALVGSIMGDSDAFKNLGKHILSMFLEGWVDKLITQQLVMPFVNSMSGFFAQGYGNAVGGTAGGTTGGIGQWMPYLWNMPGQVDQKYSKWDVPETAVAGIVGYQYGGLSGGIGATVGNMLLGPIGAAIGGYFGTMLDKASREDIKIPSFDLLWEVIDGQVKNVADTWRNMGKDQGIFDAAQMFVQTTVDFFTKLSTVAGNSRLQMPDWEFNLKGLGINIQDALNQQTAQGIMQIGIGSYSRLSEVFGPNFQAQIQKMFMDTMTKNPGMFVFGQARQTMQDYTTWKFNQFASMPSDQAQKAFDEWMKQQDIFSPVGRPGIRANSIFDLFQSMHPGADFTNPEIFPQLEQFAKIVTPGWFNRGEIALGSTDAQAPWKNFFTDLDKQITDIFNMVTVGMGQAFAASLETGEFQTFEQNFKKSIMGSVEQSLIQSFANQTLIPIIFKPLYGSEGHPAITDVLQQYSEGKIGLPEAQGYLGSIFGDLNQTLAGFEPMWNILNTGFQGLSQALGLNTAALTGSSGTIDNFINELTGSSLNPSQSIAGAMEKYNTALEQARLDPTNLPTYFSQVKNEYLPMMQGISPNYQESYSSVLGDLGGLKNLYTPYMAPEYHELPVNEPITSSESPYYEGGVPQVWDDSVSRARAISGGNSGDQFIDKLADAISKKLAPMLLDLKETMAAPKEISGDLTFAERGFAHLIALEIKSDVEIAEALKQRL